MGLNKKKACPTCIGHFVFSESRNASLFNESHIVLFKSVLILSILHTKYFRRKVVPSARGLFGFREVRAIDISCHLSTAASNL